MPPFTSREHVAVSTHASVKDATIRGQGDPLGLVVSTHASVKDATAS